MLGGAGKIEIHDAIAGDASGATLLLWIFKGDKPHRAVLVRQCM
jgi:hypothetical protein